MEQENTNVIFEWIKTKYFRYKDVLETVCTYCLVLFIGFASGWVLCDRNHIYDDTSSIRRIDEQFERFREDQSIIIGQLELIKRGIEQDIGTVKSTTERARDIEESANNILENNRDFYYKLRESAERIKRAKSIVEEVGTTKN